jgi:nicotinamide riboside transporter PnuC
MIGWLLLGLIVIGLLVFINVEHSFRKIKVMLLIVLVLLFLFSIFQWSKSGQFDVSSPKNIINSVSSYVGWTIKAGVALFDAGKESFKTVGNVILPNEKIDGRK